MSHNTLRDVAVHAGVSHQTVSNVLNGHPSIRPATRERVLDSVRALDYHPNQAAKALRESRITTLCCAFYDHDPEILTDPYYNLIQSAFIAEANKCGFDMTTAFCLNGQASGLKMLRQRYLQKQFGGMIAAGINITPNQAKQWEDWGMPCILFDHQVDGSNICNVTTNYYAGMMELVEHHVAQGRKHLALIIPTKESGSSSESRLRGFQAATAQLGVLAQVISGDWTYESGEHAMHQLWLQDKQPDAILAANDRMAAGALRAAHDLKLNIPSDVAISGFDDFEFARYTHPALTTVYAPHAEMARYAVQQLVKLVSGEQPETRQFPISLIVREST